MAQRIVQLFAAACFVNFADLGRAEVQTPLDGNDVTDFMQVDLLSEPHDAKHEPHELALMRGSRGLVVSKAARKVSKAIHWDVDMLLTRLGVPTVLRSVLGGFVHDAVMEFRKLSLGTQEFVDHFFFELEDMEEEDLGIDSILQAVRRASTGATHLDQRVQDFIGEVEPILEQVNSTHSMEPTVLLQALSRGLGKVGVPAELLSVVDAVPEMISAKDGFQPKKLLGTLSKLYRGLGLPEEVVQIMENVTQSLEELFPGSGTDLDLNPAKLIKTFEGLMRNLGMPPATSELFADLGSMFNGSKTPTPDTVLNSISKAMSGLGVPEHLMQGMDTYIRSAARGEQPDAEKLLGPLPREQLPALQAMAQDVGQLMKSMAALQGAGTSPAATAETATTAATAATSPGPDFLKMLSALGNMPHTTPRSKEQALPSKLQEAMAPTQSHALAESLAKLLLKAQPH